MMQVSIDTNYNRFYTFCFKHIFLFIDNMFLHIILIINYLLLNFIQCTHVVLTENIHTGSENIHE